MPRIIDRITREMVDDNLVSVRYEGDNIVIYVKGRVHTTLEPRVVELIKPLLHNSNDTVNK